MAGLPSAGGSFFYHESKVMSQRAAQHLCLLVRVGVYVDQLQLISLESLKVK